MASPGYLVDYPAAYGRPPSVPPRWYGGLTMLRILLVDDHEVVRRGLRGLLEAEAGWQVVGEARTGREAVALAERLRPDVVILDLALPELHGLEVTRRIHTALPGAQVLVFTMHRSERLMREALRAGARGYVLKADPAERLVAAVRTLAEHRPFLPEELSAVLLGAFVRGEAAGEEGGDALTGREREVVLLLAEGRGNREIAEALGISVNTVETHRAAVMRKLEVSSLANLVRYAIRNQLIEP